MYAARKMPGSLQGIESLNFNSYWKAIKDRIHDLQQLPTWATNHAMKLGITVSNLEKQGKHAEVRALKTEIDKVNDDIAKAWKVKGYIDKYLPEWMSVASKDINTGAPITPAFSQPAKPPAGSPGAYIAPSTTQEVTGWLKNIVGLNGQDRGLGIAPILVISASGIAALAYVVTVGMSLWQDYRYKKDLTQAMIEGKVSSGQIKDILTVTQQPDSMLSNVIGQAGGNLATIAVLGALGYAAFWYMTAKRVTS